MPMVCLSLCGNDGRQQIRRTGSVGQPVLVQIIAHGNLQLAAGRGDHLGVIPLRTRLEPRLNAFLSRAHL